MLKYFTKLATEIFPSVLATIIGAYIVNHYIVARPAADTASAVVSADAKKVGAKNDWNKNESNKNVADKNDSNKTGSKPAVTEVASLPEAGVKAKGISEKAILGKAAAEAPKGATDSLYEKLIGKPGETALVPADAHHGPLTPREKAEKAEKDKPVAKTVPAPAAAVPAPAAAPVETASVPEDHRDAADLARAAIERLRATDGTPSRKQDAVRVPEPPRPQDLMRAGEPPRVQDAPRVVVAPTAQPIRPLPPPITVGGSAPDPTVAAMPPQNPAYTGSVPADDPDRPTPPADIPPPPPVNLRAADMSPREQATKVAQDMLSAAKSVFHAVLPRPQP